MELAHCPLQGQNSHASGRQLLETLYRQTTGQPMPSMATTARGKPYFVDSPWHFSISHTKNHVFCALSQHPIGMDAEETDRQVSPHLARRWLSPSEQQRVAGNGDVLRLWVLKEAYAKLTGQGLGNYLKNTDFDPNDRRIQEIDGCFVAILEGE